MAAPYKLFFYELLKHVNIHFAEIQNDYGRKWITLSIWYLKTCSWKVDVAGFKLEYKNSCSLHIWKHFNLCNIYSNTRRRIWPGKYWPDGLLQIKTFYSKRNCIKREAMPVDYSCYLKRMKCPPDWFEVFRFQKNNIFFGDVGKKFNVLVFLSFHKAGFSNYVTRSILIIGKHPAFGVKTYLWEPSCISMRPVIDIV